MTASMSGDARAASYPARLDGHLEPDLSRWLWLVKWFLAIPHFVVLAFLALAGFVLTVVAWFSILFTGRYPRSIFDFNVNVMRWWWRVTFYVETLGTDRYPPFSLAPDPTYPADLTVDYPEHLTRWKVLVKWFLAIPHLLIVGVFTGGVVAAGSDQFRYPGLLMILGFVVGIMLLVRDRYPESLFDFIMGLNRWCLRVFAYVWLLRDEYPPFRFDAGGTDPGTIFTAPPPVPPADQSGAAVTVPPLS